MKRDIYLKLMAWRESDRRKPLVLQGARQVGKTYALKWLGKEAYGNNVVYCNFEEDKKLKQLFSDFNPKKIVGNLAAFFRVKIEPEKTLLIFDEIQECNEALLSLKYFREKANEYHIVAAGSLLGIKLSEHKSFPVGQVNFLDLRPLTFSEFLSALGYDDLRNSLESKTDFLPLNDGIHLLLVDLLKRYIMVGGMPEVVREHAKSPEDYLMVRQIHEEIRKSYELDFVKHTTADEAVKISLVWNKIPMQLAKENRKFIFTALRKSARGRDFESSLQWLSDASMIHRAHLITKPGIPLKSYAEPDAFKVFMLDSGLLCAMSDLDPSAWAASTDVFTEFRGALTENFIAQQLVGENISNELYYWKSGNMAEIDFVFAHDRQVFPLEVKAGQATKAKSLSVFMQTYRPTRAVRMNLLNFSEKKNLVNVPLYAVSRLKNLLSI